MGFLLTSKGDYFIEPVKGHNHTDEPKHPHLIYKRAALPDELHMHNAHAYDPDHMTCGVEGEWMFLHVTS